MTENKRYTTDNGSNEDVCLVDNVTGKEFESDFDEIVDLLNEKDERIRELEKEVLDLRAEVGRLNSKKEIEKPHWLKYESSKGYTRQVNQDIRFKGDVDD